MKKHEAELKLQRKEDDDNDHETRVALRDSQYELTSPSAVCSLHRVKVVEKW